MRSETEFSRRDPTARSLIDSLISFQGNSEQYRSTMRTIGARLGASIFPMLPVGNKDICVVCSVEDADFLARGFIEQLTAEGILAERVHLICFWNDQIRENGVSLSPVTKQYKEHFPRESTVVIVKSIISGACVVKTNLSRAISFTSAENVFVAAPVMLEGAQDKLSKEFPLKISEKFKFVHFVTDTEKDGENVFPGIGGSVYELLGLGDFKQKNKYVPDIVKERRQLMFA
jgi:hypothetical protein